MRRHGIQLHIIGVAVGTVFLTGPPACVSQKSPLSQCLSYEPSEVNVTGSLIRKTFAGPPNYESVRKGDRPETYWLLKLSGPVCVSEDKADPDLNPSQAFITQIQLVLDPELYKSEKPLVGSKVVARGTLFGAHTGHHHTPVLLSVKSIEPAVH
jgi:hypothetical protein